MAEFQNRKKRALAILILLDLEDDEPQKTFPKRRKRNIWVRSWIAKKELGRYHHLLKELESGDEVGYENFFKRNARQFRFIVDWVAYRIQNQNTVMQESIRPNERIAVTLRFLATMFTDHVIL